MSESLWAQAKAIVGDALDRAAADRDRFIGDRCAGQPDLRVEVDSLIAAHLRAGDFIDQPFVPSWPDDDEEAESGQTLRPGTTVGSYRLLKQIGRGGMGAVYLAARADRTFEKQVAIKIVAGHVAPPELIRRFLEERRILATLNHPNIAHVLDAGATADGVPFVVMEYVDGTSIDQHCQDQRLPLRRRLEMFGLVCDAVHHAHQRLVVHRDIKPANILVTADGVPKLLDFGIAKLLEEGRVLGDTGLRAFTPESASPEQIRNEPATVTSDVYSLGALLYRLLTDQKVFDFTSATDSEIVRTICEQDPRPPSVVARHGERVSRDLDWITLKALRKEPDRRYASVAQLSDDCRRYLSGEAVLAAPDAFGYRAGKFLRRHWMGTSAAAAIVAILAATGIVVRSAQQRAERRFSEVRQLANTVVGELYDAIAEVPGSTAARQLLVTRALGYLDNLAREAGNDVSLKADLADAYQKIGDVQGNPYSANLGDVNGARASFAKLIDLRRAIHDSQRTDGQSALGLGRAYSRVGDLDLAQAQYAKAVESYQQARALLDEARAAVTSGEDVDIEQSRVLGRMGVALTWAGRRDEAKTVLQEAIRQTQLLVDRPGAPRIVRRGLAVHYGNLGDVYHYQRDFEHALEAHQRAVELMRVLEKETPAETTSKRDVLMVLARVSADFIELRRHDDAIHISQESIALEEALVKSDPVNVQFQFDLADMYGNLAVSQRETGQLDAALQSIELSITTSERAAARNPQFTAHQYNFASAVSQLGLIRRDRAETAQAIVAFRRAIDILGTVPGDQRDPTQVLTVTTDLGRALAAEAQRLHSPALWREARTALQQALDGWRSYQKGAGATEDHKQEMDAVVADLAKVESAFPQ